MSINPKATTLAIEGPAKTADATIAQTHATMQTGANRAMKTAEQFVHFGQGNLEAFMKSSQVLASGWQDMTKHMVAHAQTTMDETAATFKAMSGVKSIKEAIALQTAFTKSYLEKSVAETTKLTEQSMKLAEAATAPIAARMNAAVETFAHTN